MPISMSLCVAGLLRRRRRLMTRGSPSSERTASRRSIAPIASPSDDEPEGRHVLLCVQWVVDMVAERGHSRA
eukprot:2103947-Prymnesium_polylepis.1